MTEFKMTEQEVYVFSSRTFSVILQGQIWSSLFGDVNNPHLNFQI